MKNEDTVQEVMKNRRYLSPVENNPRYHERYFEKYASNYENLKVGGLFSKRIIR